MLNTSPTSCICTFSRCDSARGYLHFWENCLKTLVRLSVLAFSALGLIVASPAFAATASTDPTDLFTLTDTVTSTVYTFSLPIPADASYTVSATGLSAFSALSYTVNGTPETGGTVGFFEAADGGGLALEDSSFNLLDVTDSVQLFAGSLTDPIFTPGTYAQYDANGDPTGTLVINSTATTPEPSSIALLGTGALGLAGVIRRKLTR